MFVKKSQAYPIFFRCWRVSRAIMNMVTLHGFQRFKNISDLTILLYEKTWKIHLHLKLKPFYELRDISTGTSHSFISFAWGILWEFDKYFWLTVLGSQKYLPSCYSTNTTWNPYESVRCLFWNVRWFKKLLSFWGKNFRAFKYHKIARSEVFISIENLTILLYAEARRTIILPKPHFVRINLMTLQQWHSLLLVMNERSKGRSKTRLVPGNKYK